VVGNATRTAITSDRGITGLSAVVIAGVVSEVGPLWHQRHQARLASRPRKRVVSADAKHRVVFVDRLLATLVHHRHGVTHDVLAYWFGMDRSTVTRAIGEVLRPLLAERGCAISPDVRLRTVADLVDPPRQDREDRNHRRHRDPCPPPDRRPHGPGEMKAMVLTDRDGRLLFCGPTNPKAARTSPMSTS
jgi:hypothetical protein